MSNTNPKKPTSLDGGTTEFPSVERMFLLEESYPDARGLFASHALSVAPDGDFVVAIDTNVLILPYKIDAEDLSALSTTYRMLAKENKLYLPARASREFIRLRDSKLAEVVTGLNDRLSRLEAPRAKLSPILEGVEGYDQLPALAEAAEKAVSEYRNALKSLIAKIKGWRGDDPVSLLYAEVFNGENVIEAPGQREELRAEWDRRSASKLPPGYKDSGKEDGGIGDFLIWKSLLHIGSVHKKDLIFLTLDEKSDWAIRSSGQAIYPRPELIDEYRRASDGRTLLISHLGDFLKQMNVADTVVAKVKEAETEERSEEATALDRAYPRWGASEPYLRLLKEMAAKSAPQPSLVNQWKTRKGITPSSVHMTIETEPAPAYFVNAPLDMVVVAWWDGTMAIMKAREIGYRFANLGQIEMGVPVDADQLSYSDTISINGGDVFVVRVGGGVWQAFRLISTKPSGNLITLVMQAVSGAENDVIFTP